MGAPELEQAIDAELRLLQSNVRGDARLLGVLLADDFVEIGASGRIWTRAEIIAELVASPNLDVEVVDMAARHIDDHIVLVSYTTTSAARRVVRSSWWRLGDGGWRCFFHQGTVADQAGGDHV